MSKLDALPSFHAHSRQQWRDWLAQHHQQEQGVWLITYKKAANKPTLSYAEAVEEALCFGWVDSKPKALDTERSALLYTPRKSTSVWSKSNKERIERLTAAGLMMPAGQRMVDIARQNGMWDHLNALDTLDFPAPWTNALAAQPAAQAFFDQLSESYKRQFLQQLLAAKTDATRDKRIAAYIAAFLEGRNPLDWAAEQKRLGKR